MRLIDADALADVLFEKRKNYPQWVADTIGNMPDAIVSCKDCKHHETSEVFDSYCNNLCTDVPMDWFCADGVKKE